MIKDLSQLFHEASRGIEIFNDLTLNNFLDNFDYSKNDFGHATMLELSLSTVFLIEVAFFKKGLEEDARDNFSQKKILDFAKHFSTLLKNSGKELLDISEYRYSQYTQNINKEPKNWYDFHTDMVLKNIFGTIHSNKIQYSYPLYSLNEDIIQREKNFYQIEILNFLKIKDTINNIIENDDYFEEALINSEKQKKEPDKNEDRCYIATSVYGSYHSEEVLVLRRFRDFKLKGNNIGERIIRIYYLKSPYFANKVEQYPLLRCFTKIFIDIIVFVLKRIGY